MNERMNERMNGVLYTFVHIGETRPREPPMDGEMNHGGSPQYQIFYA